MIVCLQEYFSVFEEKMYDWFSVSTRILASVAKAEYKT